MRGFFVLIISSDCQLINHFLNLKRCEVNHFIILQIKSPFSDFFGSDDSCTAFHSQSGYSSSAFATGSDLSFNTLIPNKSQSLINYESQRLGGF